MNSEAFNLAFQVHRNEMNFSEGLLKSVEAGAQEDFIEALNSLTGKILYTVEQLDELIEKAQKENEPDVSEVHAFFDETFESQNPTDSNSNTASQTESFSESMERSASGEYAELLAKKGMREACLRKLEKIEPDRMLEFLQIMTGIDWRGGYGLNRHTPLDAAILKTLFQRGNAECREIVRQRALKGWIEAEGTLAELAIRGNGEAMVFILQTNLRGHPPANLWRSDAQLLTQAARFLAAEYPRGGPVTDFIKELIQNHCPDFIGYLLHSLIQFHKVSLMYLPAAGEFPIVLTNERKKEYALQYKDAGPPPASADNEKKSTTPGGKLSRNPFLKETLSLNDLSRIVAMIYIHRPAAAYRYFGAIYDSLCGKISVLFENWTNDPIVAHALCLQAQGGYPGSREQVLHLVEAGIDLDRIDPKRFDFTAIPGFLEDILPTIAKTNPKASDLLYFMAQFSPSSSSEEMERS
ncbi:MAG: hypothetical protein AB1656_11580 [Candidatus Omnitrophota bacterium]